MASTDSDIRFNTPRLVGALLAVLIAAGLCALPAWAEDDPPKKKDAPTTQSAEKKDKEEGEKPKPRPDLDAAKRAAMASIGKDTPKADKKDDKSRQQDPEKSVAEADEGKQLDAGPHSKATPRTSRDAKPADPKHGRAAGNQPPTRGRQPQPGTAPGRGKMRQPHLAPKKDNDRKDPRRDQPTPDSDLPQAQPVDQPSSPTADEGTEPLQDAGAVGPVGDATPSPISDVKTRVIFDIDVTDPEARTYRIDYVDTPWADVLADFSRMSGLSWLNQPDPPLMDNITFRSPGVMTYQEALDQLNELLLEQPLNKYLIQRQDKYLTIKRLPDLIREIPPEKMYDTFEEFEAAKPNPYDIVLTYFDVPEGWSPYQIIEEFRPRFSDTYGTQVVGDRIELSGLAQEHYRFRDVVLKLAKQAPPPIDPRAMQTFDLKVAKAADVQTLLKLAFPVEAPGGRGRNRSPGIDPTAEQAKSISVFADVRNNRLFVKAPPDVLVEIDKMVRDLDSGNGTEPTVMRFITIENTGAASIMNILKPIFTTQKAAIAKQKATEWVPPEVEAAADRDIFADPSTNTVTLIGNPIGVADAERQVKELDVATQTEVTEIVELMHADADEMVGLLPALLSATPRGSMPPRITAQGQTKLIVVCARPDWPDIQATIQKLDVPKDDEPKEHFVKLQSAKPSVIAPLLQQIIGGASSGVRVQQQRRPTPQKGRPAPPPAMGIVSGGAAGPSFAPDDATMTLLVICTDKDWPRIDELIKRFDEQAVEPVYRTVKLEAAKAADVVDMLQQMFPPEVGQNSPPCVITADNYNNAINFFAAEDYINKVTPFIEELDKNTDGELTVIHLEYARAAEIAPILQQMFPGSQSTVTAAAAPAQPVRRGGRQAQRPPVSPRGGDSSESTVSIIAEPMTNSLFVRAPQNELKRIQDLVAQMEDASKPTRVIIPCYNRTAEEVVQTVQSLMGGGTETRSIPGRPGQPARTVQVPSGTSQIKMVPDGKRIIIEGSQQKVAEAVQWIEQVDVAGEDKPVFRKVYVSDAEEVEKQLRAMLALSAGSSAPAPQQQGGRRGGRRPAPRPSAPASSDVQIYANTWENTLLIRAMPEKMIEINELLAQIESDATAIDPTQEPPEPEPPFFVYNLKYKTAFDISWTVEDLVNTDGKSTIRLDEGPDERTVLVRGCKPAQKDFVISVIQMFDVSDGYATSDMLVFESDKVSAEAIIQTLQRYQSPFGRTMELVEVGGASGRVQVIDIHEGEQEPETTPQTIPETPQTGEPVSFHVPGMMPGLTARALEGVLAACLAQTTPESKSETDSTAKDQPAVNEGAPPQPLPPAVEPEVRFSSTSAEAAPAEKKVIRFYRDPITDKVVVEIPEDERAFLEKYVDDVIGDKSPTVYRIFPLKYTDVNAASTLLTSIFNVSTPTPRAVRQPRQQQPQQGQQGQKGQQGKQPQQRQPQPAPAPPARIKVVPDARTRSLFVAAPLSDIPLITEMLREIDSPVRTIEGTIKIFQLENLDATQVIENLREVLGLTGASAVQPQRGRPTRRGTPQQQAAQQQQEQLQLQGAEGQGTVVAADALKLTADTQTNSIIAKGPPDTLALVGDLIQRLEEQTNTAKVEMRRISLTYASASDVASIVKEVVGPLLSGPGGARGGRGGGSRTSVSVNADTRTNSVIAAGPMKDLDRVEKIVKDLDVDDTGGAGIKQIPVKGDVRAYADTLKTLFGGQGRQSDVIISPNAETGVIVVKAPTSKIAEIEKQVALMDEKVESEQTRRPIQLLVADAESVAQKLQELFGEQARGRGAKGSVSIKGNKSNSTLYVQCPDSMFDEIRQVAKDMDKPPSDMQVKSFPLKHASAIGVQKQLETLMRSAITNKGMGDVKLDLIGVLPDARTNSLIVSGGPITFSLIEQVLAQVDVEAGEIGKRETKTYSFNNAIQAQEIARNIGDLFRGESPGTTGVEPPTVTYNSAGNTLTVKATTSQHDEIQKNIIDPVQAAVGEAMQDYQIKLQYARADEIKPVLEEFMNKWRSSRGNKPQDACAITADPNGNLLLVNCSPSTKEIFDKQLAELDAETMLTGARSLRTYQCKYANINAVRDAIIQAFQRTGRVSSREQVNVSLDGNTNAVIVMANEKNHEQIAKMIESMDLEDTGGKLTRIFEFKHAEPWQVPRVIAEQFRTSSRNPKDQVTASYINGTMSVVVSASPENMLKVEDLVNSMDAADADKKVTKFVTLANARADVLANLLNQAYRASVPRSPTGQYDVNYYGDINTNQMIVTAPESQMEELLAKLAELDVADSGRITKAFQVKYAAPWTLAGVISNQFRSASRNPNDQVVANYEDGTNAIIVTAKPENMAKVEQLIMEADVQSSGGRTTRSFQLKYAYPWRMADIVSRQFQSRSRNINDQVTATYEEGTNSVIVTANEENMAQIVDLIERSDIAGMDIKTTRFIRVKFARADELARSINEAFQAKTTRDRQGRLPVTISADLGTNSLIVTAMSDMMAEVETMVAELDIEQSEDQIRRVFKLTYADPGSVSRMIQTQFRPQLRNPSPRDTVNSSDDWTTNSVIVTASEQNMAKIEALIAEMDQPGDTMRTNYVLEVANSNAEEVARSLQQIFDAANRGRRSQQGAATIRAITGTTKIAVNANAEELKQIRELITQIDVEGGRSVHTAVMPELVSAKSVAENINKLFGAQGGRRDGPNAEYHEPTNTLLVFATDPEFDKINEQVIKVLSEQPAIGQLQIFKVPLKNALADEVAKTLQDFFDKKSGNQRSGRSFGGWRGGDTAAQQIEDQVTIMAEPTSNMLILYCTETTKGIIDDLLKDIDTDAGSGRIMEMVALTNMDAAEMLDILTEYLKISKRSPDDSNARSVPWWWDRTEEKTDDKTVLAGDMRLKAVESMNAIILVGKPDDVADAKQKIVELDVPRDNVPDAPRRIELAHANAMQLAETLNAIFNDPSRSRGRSSSDKPPVIVPEEATNTLIVRAKTSDYQSIEQMAKQLDEDMEDEPSGVRILPVPVGRDVTALAQQIEQQLNDAEKNRQQTSKTYKPSLVSIGADTTANALLVAGSKAKYEEVKALVDQLVAMGPAGGRVRTYIQLPNISPERAKEIIEQLQQSNTGGSSSSSNRGGGRRGGPRGDATWTHDRRYESLEDGRTMSPIGYSASPVVCFAQIAAESAMAQTDDKGKKKEPTTQPQRGPQTFKINKVTKTPPAKKDEPAKNDKPAPRRRRPPQATQPSELAPQPKTTTAEPVLPIPTPPGAFSGWSDEAKGAIQQRLSGAPIEVVQAGSNGIIIEGNPDDIAVAEAVLQMLSSSIKPKDVEYFKLRNSRATDLAKILQDVFQKIEVSSSEKTAGPEDKVDIIADPRTNGLYVAATEEKMKLARKLIQDNEQEDPFATPLFRSYTFKNRRVGEAGDVLKNMVSSYLKKMGLPSDAINVEFDPQTNSVLVTGGENDLKVVDKLLEILDAELPEGLEDTPGAQRSMQDADIMIVPLRIAQADQLGTLLNELLQKAATGDTPMKDFIRRMRLLDENGNPIAQISLDRPIAVFGDPDSNVLIIASTKENCLIMKQVAQAFDKEPAKAPVEQKVLDLKYADATEVADQLSAVLQDSESLTQRPGKSETAGLPEGESGALVYRAVVKADPRTNQLLIVGRPESVDVLENIVKELDVKGLDVMPFEIVKLEYASSTALEQALTDMMEQRAEALPKGTGPNADKAEKVIIKADPRSETLIIAAKAARMEELRDLVKKLDVPASALIENIRTISLKNGNATELSEKLKDLWEQRKNQREGGDSGLKLEIPAIVPDERSNALIVAASKADFEAIKAVVDKIEGLPLNPMVDIYLVRLEFNSAQQLAPAFTTLFQKRAEMRSAEGKVRPEDEVAIEVDEVSNTLIIAASRENYEVLMQKVQELDKEYGREGSVEFFVCDNVSAGRVKETLDNMFQEGPWKPGATGDSQAAQDRNKVIITIDTRSNVLMVSASPENMTLIREIYKRMNSVTRPWDVTITKLITIKHSDAVRIAAQVKEHFDELKSIREGQNSGGSNSSSGFEITVFADERSNRIVVGGDKDGIDSAVDLIERLDVKPGDGNQVTTVYRLHEAPASKVGEMIKNIFQERNQQRGGAVGAQVPDITVSIEDNDATNSMLVNASREDHVLIADLITELDRPSTIIDKARVFPLAKAKAEDVKRILDELYQGSGGDNAASPIVVVDDNRTNSVVVSAAPGELSNIAELVRRLDDTEIRGYTEVGVFLCENEDAEKMSEIITEIMTGQGADGGQQSDQARELSSMLISYSAKDKNGQPIRLEAVRENLMITYNTRSNSVVAVAPPASLKLIESLVTKLDMIQKRPVMVKVIQLQHADASKMIDLLEKMFAQDEGSEQEQEFQKDREVQVEGGLSSTGGVPTASSQGGLVRRGTFGRPRTTFVADERTNAVIAAGWPEDIDVISDVIDQLDSQAIRQRDNIVVTLVNMEATDMQTALEQFFQNESQLINDLGDSVSPQQKMDQEVSIVAHEPSNQLIISTSPRYTSRVLSVVEQLDTAPPQVMIDVLIAEVTLDDRFEMGLEFALQQLRFSETAVAGGNGVLQSSHFDVIGGTDLGAAPAGLAGVSFTITGEDFNFLVRALQSDSRLEVVQNPMIMCQDNQEAVLTVGQQVPFVQGTQTTDSGQVNASVTYEDVGVILTVEPQINPDGFVYLHIVPEISSISDSSIDLGNGTRVPVFNTRKADTTVAVKDGETVVIGGLITTQDTESESKVPFLGDLPGIGILFRTTSRSKQKTELLIAMTPRIVRTVEDGRRISIQKRDESGIITDNMKQSPMFRGLQLHPETEDQIMDLETMPTYEPTLEPMGAPSAPATPPADPGERYGPTAPRYGPIAPASEDEAVAAADPDVRPHAKPAPPVVFNR